VAAAHDRHRARFWRALNRDCTEWEPPANHRAARITLSWCTSAFAKEAGRGGDSNAAAIAPAPAPVRRGKPCQALQVLVHHVPKNIVRHVLIIVPQHVADACHLRPRDVWVATLQRLGQATDGFRNNFDPALDDPAFGFVGLEGGEGHVGHLHADDLDGLDDVVRLALGEDFCIQNTCNADASIPFRSTRCRLRLVITSAGQPRIRAAASFTSINS
jgi:hypothetical protein